MRSLFIAAFVVACNDDDVELGTGSTVPASLEWSGDMTLEGSMEIAANETVMVQPGTHVQIAPGARLILWGTLHAMGTSTEPVVFEAPEGWMGIDLNGALLGTYLQITGAGGAIRMASGRLDLADSLLDLVSPELPPDCTSIGGGTVKLDHVQITGCHCPIHINKAASAEMTNNIFDAAAVPIMLANVHGVFTGNDIVGEPGMMDVGSGITAEISGNYWGGGAPTLQTVTPAQFTGADDWSETPIEGAGPQ